VTASHTFADGSYTVILVANGPGGTDTDEVNVSVHVEHRSRIPMRRLLTAPLVALLLGGLFPLPALAADPVAAPRTASTDEDTPLTVTLSASDADPGEEPSTFVISAGPSDGTLGTITPISCTGSEPTTCTAHVVYTPDGDFNGSDSFSYTAAGADEVASGAATVSITVDPVNDDPTFTKGANQTVAEDSGAHTIDNWIQAFSVGPADESTQAISYHLSAANGSLFSVAPVVSADGTLSYTPAANAFGSTSVGIYAEDSGSPAGQSATQTFTITIDGVNDPVLAKNDALAVKATFTTVLNPLANDSAGPGESISDVTITSVTQPGKGSATITNAGTRVTYDPKGCTTGGDFFQYSISDGETTSVRTVSITINRPGQGGVATSPITDTPGVAFVTNSTMATTVPLKVSWCGVTTSTTSVRSYRLQQSTNGGSTYPTTLITSTTGRSSTRNVSVSQDYRWRVRTTDTAARTGSYRQSAISIVRRYQESSSRITYVGPWTTSSTVNASGGAQKYTATGGASASITVTNVRAFALVGPRSSSRGSFDVFVDDVLVTTVSEQATTTTYRRVLYTRSLTAGSGVSHTIRIQAVGGARIDLDAVLTLAAV